MERQVLDLSDLTFLLINVPLLFFNLTVNIFYVCCLICPSHGPQKLKQPLKALLGCLVCCSTLYCIFLPLLYYMNEQPDRLEMVVVLWAIVLHFIHNSMTCYVRLNFYYYLHIVPPRRAIWIWVKKNITSFMFWTLLLDQFFLLLATPPSLSLPVFKELTCFNNTWRDGCFDLGFNHLNLICFCIFQAYILISLYVMSVCSFSTSHYLYRHMRNVTQSGSGFNAPRIQRHMRAANTGICQGVGYMLYTAFYLFDSFALAFSRNYFIGYRSHFTVASLFISGTTVNLGIGQAVFRQRVSRAWSALKAQCNVAVVTSDGRLTSDEIADTLNS